AAAAGVAAHPVDAEAGHALIACTAGHAVGQLGDTVDALAEVAGPAVGVDAAGGGAAGDVAVADVGPAAGIGAGRAGEGQAAGAEGARLVAYVAAVRAGGVAAVAVGAVAARAHAAVGLEAVIADGALVAGGGLVLLRLAGGVGVAE